MNCKEPLSLMSKTLELLHADSRGLAVISVTADVPYHWLEQFRRGIIKNPSVNRVQALYEFLSGRKLEV
jgi:hypothetical protein